MDADFLLYSIAKTGFDNPNPVAKDKIKAGDLFLSVIRLGIAGYFLPA
ncbi:hypothetical protein GLIP_3846 [Aliiglaciecola lipolytica E3]|uniref:Uncharacterized protein n=1 Tax=Aliiglaciecola lipolytica E3 TaxID=1127673 RepID=K6YE69_9ALTE|nr:hypothetical protein GLIP_3846 [Aliiglaciecola lipolytica E3]